MTPEGKVKAKLKKSLDTIGCYYFYPQTGGYGRSGVPDIIICHKGKFIAIECKAGDNKPTALQEYNIDLIRRNQGLAMVANESNIELILTKIKEIL